ncbi:FAD-dependent oxidoreductase, partial [Acidihalobacter prosperus]
MGEREYDLIIIGGGPAGYAAALRAAQLGLNTACIDQGLDAENQPRLGGTYLNTGCIPSKVLLDSSLRYAQAENDFSKHGIHLLGVTIDLAELHARKQAEVNYLSQGIATLLSSCGVQWLKGHGLLTGQHRVAFTAHNRKTAKLLNAENIILAPGSKPARIDAAPVDGHYIVDSEGALNFDEIPKRLGIVGAGAIGLELGNAWQRFGADVLLIEAQKSFLAVADGEIAQLAYKAYTSQGLHIKLGTRVKEALTSGQGVKLQYLDAEGEKQACFDRVIIAVGRRPNTNTLYSDDSGLQLDERRFIGVDAYCRTNLPGVWAIGDAVRGPMVAHKGSEEGIMVVERIA